MKKAKILLQRITSDRVMPLPLIILVAIACMVISSYLLAGWLMRPVGDDYGSILAYHVDASWWRILPHTVIEGGGRYGQTIVSVVWYGGLGHMGLRLTAFVSVGMFLAASYLAILAWQKVKNLKPNHKLALAGAALFFMFYTMISITFPWIRGHVDNTFQDFIWLPGFITYTLPLELLAIIAASVILLPQVAQLKIKWLALIGVLSVFAGTFSEIVPAAYTEFIVIIGLYQLAQHRFKVKDFFRAKIRSYIPFLTIEAGLLFGLALNFLSPATAQRRAIFHQATTSEIIKHSITSTKQYLSTYVFANGAVDSKAIWLTSISGIALALIAFNIFKLRQSWKLVKQIALLCGFFGFMGLSSVFISFAIVFKGYGISPYTYLLPRFEIVYNIWFSLFFIFIGVLIAAMLSIIAQRQRVGRFAPAACLLVSLFILVNIPQVLQQTAVRFQAVAVFSNNWEHQDDELREDAAEGVTSATVPVIDIGDAYNITCNSGDNWLGTVKQEYYHISKICSLPE